MQYIAPEEGHRESQNVDGEGADVQLSMWDPSKNLKTLDTEEHNVGTEVVLSWNSFINQAISGIPKVKKKTLAAILVVTFKHQSIA